MDIFVYIFAAVVVATLLWFVTRKNVKEKDEDVQPPQPAQSQSEGQPRSRRRFGNRVQRGIERARQPPRVESNVVEKKEDDESSSDAEVKKVKKIGAKKQKKLLMKEERRLEREAAERQREEQKLEQEKIDQMRIKEEEKQQLEEERKEAEAKKLKEEKEKRELEEYLKMKEAFEIEEEGLERDLEEEEESQHLLEEFINYIKECKVVFLEDLASHFGLRTQDAIDRVQDLLKDGLLTGVIDDRGKFIYISMEELKAVADFVEQRGRVSISELARVSNSLINIKPEKELTLSN